METFAERLRKLRLENNLTQKELGEILGYSTSTITNWENNRREPCFNCLIDIALFFHCSIDYLIGLED